MKTGTLKWQAALDEVATGDVALDAGGKTIYLVASKNQQASLVALEAQSGHELWRHPLPAGEVNVLDALYVSGDVVVVPGYKGEIDGMNSADGTLRWAYKLPAKELGTITVQDGRVWVGLQDGSVLALNVQSGQLVAHSLSEQSGEQAGITSEHPVVIGQRVLFPHGIHLLGFQAP